MKKYDFTENGFNELFVNARLTSEEIEYFTVDMKTALSGSFETVNQYYSLNETQYCIKNYTLPKYRRVMKTGLSKINFHLQVNANKL